MKNKKIWGMIGIPVLVISMVMAFILWPSKTKEIEMPFKEFTRLYNEQPEHQEVIDRLAETWDNYVYNIDMQIYAWDTCDKDIITAQREIIQLWEYNPEWYRDYFNLRWDHYIPDEETDESIREHNAWLTLNFFVKIQVCVVNEHIKGEETFWTDLYPWIPTEWWPSNN